MDVILSTDFYHLGSLWSIVSTDLEHALPRDVLYALCQMPSVLQFTRRSDYIFYQALVEVLIPDVLRPIPSKSRLLQICVCVCACVHVRDVNVILMLCNYHKIYGIFVDWVILNPKYYHNTMISFGRLLNIVNQHLAHLRNNTEDVVCSVAGSLTHVIRNFAKGLESCLKTAMFSVPDEMVKVKVNHFRQRLCQNSSDLFY